MSVVRALRLRRVHRPAAVKGLQGFPPEEVAGYLCTEQQLILMDMETGKVNIYNLIILDESGSMSSIYDETIQAINEALCGIRRNQEEFPEQNHMVSVVTFEGNGMSGVKLYSEAAPGASADYSCLFDDNDGDNARKNRKK